ncbi:MAG: EamA family transporter [Proteobacteria bacterium]|nr:EamA family transporter [Pseudomonadota bacterium]
MVVTRTRATYLGCIAIILWSIDTLINLHLNRLPVFQVLASAWMICFLIYAMVVSVRKNWHTVKYKPIVWVMGASGICGAHAASVGALRFAPPEQVSTLSVSWPIFVVAMGGWLLRQGPCWRSFLSSLIGFIGVAIVLTDGKLFSGYHFDYTQGYLLAILSFILWSSYVLITHKVSQINSAMIGMYIGLGSIFAFCFLFSSNAFIQPTLFEWLLIILGGCILAVSYFCWDVAMKHGHFTLLSVLSYFNPILTISLLTLLGLSHNGLSIWIGAFLVILAALMCSGILNRAVKAKV